MAGLGRLKRNRHNIYKIKQQVALVFAPLPSSPRQGNRRSNFAVRRYGHHTIRSPTRRGRPQHRHCCWRQRGGAAPGACTHAGLQRSSLPNHLVRRPRGPGASPESGSLSRLREPHRRLLAAETLVTACRWGGIENSHDKGVWQVTKMAVPPDLLSPFAHFLISLTASQFETHRQPAYHISRRIINGIGIFGDASS
jgi:hypothetical protein